MSINNREFIHDYISNQEVRATPEEVEAVQPFVKLLVEEYNYPKEYIQTHPQFRIKSRPSDNKKTYPIDIAVFNNSKKDSENLAIIVECKKKNRKDGISQLETYLNLSNASIGVWFNGDERIFLRKIWINNVPKYEIIPDIPKFGEDFNDIGKYRRKDLEKPHNLKQIFKSIRHFLAGNATGTTRDEELAKQIINILFCKIWTEKFTNPDDPIEFRASLQESPETVAIRIKKIFESVKSSYRDVFDFEDKIELDDNSIYYVVGSLQKYSLMDAERDVVADAFEVFISHALKGGQGQFFTPRNVVKFIIDFLDPNYNSLIIDPACGSGGFLIESLKHIWKKIDNLSHKFKWPEMVVAEEKKDAAIKYIRGIEKDSFLAKVTKAYMAIMGDGRSGIYCENSLENPKNWTSNAKNVIKMNSFDFVIANPPFGSKIKLNGQDLLKQYDLGHKWTKTDYSFEKGKIKESESPEILFIERIIDLLKIGGRCGIVLPDGIFNDSESYVRNWLLKKVKIIGIIDLCKETFQPNTQTKTSMLFFEKTEYINLDYDIFMGVAYYCGHNRRGIGIDKDDLPKILNNFKAWNKGEKIVEDKNCFIANIRELINSDLWIPKHYSPYYKGKLNELKNKYPMVKLSEIATIKKGDEVGSDNYINFIERNEADIPFIRTGDLINSVVNQTPDNFVDIYIYIDLKQDIQPNDVLFTKDGKIGICAMLTNNDKVIIGSGIVRVRLKDEAIKKYGLTQEYLFAMLSNKYIGYYQAIRNTVVAATIPHLREKRIMDFEIPIFDKEKIIEITDSIRQSLELKDKSKEIDSNSNSLIFDNFKN